jgi:hypothetical protein
MDEAALLRDLGEPGCPTCRGHERRESHYFFWFFVENYHDRDVVQDFAKSRGFCRKHCALLLAQGGQQGPLTYCYLMATQELLEVLAEPVRRRGRPRERPDPARCPACRSIASGEHGSVWTYSHLLVRPEALAEYGPGGHFCYEHLRTALGWLPTELATHLYGVHAQALEGARRTLDSNPAGVMAETLGSETLFVPPSEPLVLGNGAASADPIRAMAAALKRPDACPVCAGEVRALAEWMSWLIRAQSEGADVDDVMPECPEHLWAGFRAGGEEFARAIAGRALEGRLRQIEQGRLCLARWESGRRSLRGRIAWHLWRGRSERAAFASMFLQPPPCPLCSRIATSADRAIELLGALLLDDTHGRAYHRGHGLCVRHFMRALEMPLPSASLAMLGDVQVARLTELEWRLSEVERKSSWSIRPEAAMGGEAAWRIALRRFAGTSFSNTILTNCAPTAGAAGSRPDVPGDCLSSDCSR